MKKRIFALILCVSLAFTMVGCESEKEMYYSYDLSEYIKLGDYKDLEITLFDTSATEEEIEKYTNQWIEQTTFYEKVDKIAEKGDRVNINYVGTIGGVAFEGGTAKDQELVLGSAGYIEGFEDGILGMKPGEIKDINVTFPENYGVAELNGKAAVFEITLNSIKKEVKGELTDEFLGSHEVQYPTVADLKNAIKEDIESQRKEQERSINQDSIITKIKETSEIKKLPQNELDRHKNDIKTSLERSYNDYKSYQGYNGSIVDFINENTGKNVKTADEFYKEYSEVQVTIELVLAAIAKEEGISVTPGEIKSFLEPYATNYNKTIDQVTEELGGAEAVEFNLICRNTLSWLEDNTIFLDKEGNKVDYPLPTPVPTATAVPGSGK